MKVSSIVVNLVLALCCFVFAPANAAPYVDYSADVFFNNGVKAEKKCGSVTVKGQNFSFDSSFPFVGKIQIIGNGENHSAYVLSDKMKAYVAIPVNGDMREWRNVLNGIVSQLAPFGQLASIKETETTVLGKERYKKVSVDKSKVEFSVSFLGQEKKLSVFIWENEQFLPFPLKVMTEETKKHYPATIRLDNIAGCHAAETLFRIPGNYTRYASVMEFILQAMTTFQPVK